MSEEYTIQCENCGTIYPDTDEVCPYCGQPQPQSGPYVADDLPPEQELEDEFYAGQDGIPADEGYLPPEAGIYPEEEYIDERRAEDDIFAIVGDEPEQDEYDAHDAYEETYLEDDEDAFEDDLAEAEIEPQRRLWPRLLLGCLGILVCIGLFYGGVGLIAVIQGLQERTLAVQTEAEEHYRRGQEHLTNDSLELAIAEFELALSLNPNLHPAREALHEAQRISQSMPTPTSETRLAAARALMNEAETEITQENWSLANEKLSQVRDLDPDYQAVQVSELLYKANYQQGLQLITPDQIDEALLAFELALAERPDDKAVMGQMTKASLYQEGQRAAEQDDLPNAIKAFRQLYRQDSNYLDVRQQLLKTYVQRGDELAKQGDWCEAEAQYIEAVLLQPDDNLKAKSDRSYARCREAPVAAATVTSPAVKPTSPAGSSARKDTDIPIGGTPTITTTAVATTTVSSGPGRILFSAFNPNEARWEILSVPARGGSRDVLAIDATMPALSPNGRWLLYHSELIEAEGFHILDSTTGEDKRITMFRRHILPRWGGDSKQFLFAAEEPQTQRWQIHLGFADGKSDPIIVRDGRTPDWSPDNSLVAYQGSDPDGNNPGLYLAPFSGGEPTRLTNHESDRTPDFSPDGSHLAYMSTRNGNWDIYTISAAGSAPRQITTAPGNDGLPVWSPDGSQIAYVSDMDGNWAIYVVDAKGGTPYRVTDWDGSNRPDWLLAQIWWGR